MKISRKTGLVGLALAGSMALGGCGLDREMRNAISRDVLVTGLRQAARNEVDEFYGKNEKVVVNVGGDQGQREILELAVRQYHDKNLDGEFEGDEIGPWRYEGENQVTIGGNYSIGVNAWTENSSTPIKYSVLGPDGKFISKSYHLQTDGRRTPLETELGETVGDFTDGLYAAGKQGKHVITAELNGLSDSLTLNITRMKSSQVVSTNHSSGRQRRSGTIDTETMLEDND